MRAEDKQKISHFYNDKFATYGRDVRSVGWGKKEDQNLRFDVLTRNIDLRGKTILDVGCGLGDLVGFLDEKYGPHYKYIGIDLSGDMIADARKRWEKHEFIVGDIFSVDFKSKIDVSVLSGALTYKIEDNETYARKCMEKMFEVSEEMAGLNFMTMYVDYALEKNHHYSPEAMFAHAKTLTRYANLIHDYPLWEFTIQMFKISKT